MRVGTMECFDTGSFEREVAQQLAFCGIDLAACPAAGVAVSGGADSICLLTVLHRIAPAGFVLKAVTVDHNIRSPEESGGDAAFVESYCRSIGVPCRRMVIPRGKVQELARMRGSGTEEAARVLRYECFERFSEEEQLSFLCLAHHRNDQLETIVMRFLQGGGTEALGGIPAVRGRYVRPLLPFPRSSIESYLAALGIPFRTDKTNADPAMLRNCIRTRIMPFLDREVPGWQTAALSLSAKMRDDDDALQELAEAAARTCVFRESGGVVRMSAAAFCRQPRAVRRRLLYRALSAVGARSRVPYRLVSAVLAELSAGQRWRGNAAGIVISCDGSDIFVQKEQKLATESGFFVIIKEVGVYAAGCWTVQVERSGNGIVLNAEGSPGSGSIYIEGFGFPFAFRSRQCGDVIRNASGSYTAVSKVLDGWKCGSRRDLVPVLQDLRDAGQQLVCIWGAAAGFENWIVKVQV